MHAWNVYVTSAIGLADFIDGEVYIDTHLVEEGLLAVVVAATELDVRIAVKGALSGRAEVAAVHDDSGEAKV
ncbi:hypothetical protein F0562_008515 [Nyssa sinensis]|uniref:Uncharacterized protein n=1 Tax=Nyssa sinensis TaxID=561372 RepID=A0A5J5A8R4_9ASTE|nr:hypothetical protein F0562_008515 [Nyssa sinensis]